MSGNPIFTLGGETPKVVNPSVESIRSFSATLVEQGSVLDHFHRTGGNRGRCTLMLAMIG